MPATDGLQPQLTPAERTIVKSYGGWTNFMHSMGLKPWEHDDAEEGLQIVRTFAAADQDRAKADAGGSTGNSKSKK